MLRQLYIRHYALIEELDIPFHEGFSVITGETGAGKSIILGALGLLLGNRSETRLIMQGKEKCTVEGHFDLTGYGLEDFFHRNDIEYDEKDCIIRRELNINGKSRAFINDSPVQLSVMHELGEKLIDIHSQHQNLLLRNESFQLNTIDIIAKDDNQLTEYQIIYKKFIEAKQQAECLEKNIAEIHQREDLLRFQHEELTAARLSGCSQEALEQESRAMSHEEDIKRALYASSSLLTGEENSISTHLKTVADHLRDIEDLLPETKEWLPRVESCRIELNDIAHDINTTVEGISYDPQRLEAINEKLNTIYSLEKKYHVANLDDLISLRDSISAQLESISGSDEQLQAARRQAESLQSACEQMAAILSTTRQKAAKKAEDEILASLHQLGMPNAQFRVAFEKKPLSADGNDKTVFLFSANSNIAPQPIQLIASGGEVSRVMLALKTLISKTVGQPTIILDEIDAGVSGSVAQKMAAMMADMSKCGRQVICITHLPQIAASGQNHYRVEKAETGKGAVTRMQFLNNNERIIEIAQMLSGDNITQAAVNNARELLNYEL